MITYNRYINNQDHVWYDSSNVLYSRCYDNKENTKTLKVVYKGGKTYVYRDVDVNDYLAFKNAQSNGKALNEFIIKKYKETCARISDTDMEQLSQLRESFETDEKEVSTTQMSNLVYHLDCVDSDGRFLLSLNGKRIYNGIEGEVSILNLFKAMGVPYSMTIVDELPDLSDENKDSLACD